MTRHSGLIYKTVFLVFLFILLLPIPSYAINDPGCCTSQGGINSCQFSTGKVVCNNGTYSATCGCSAPTATPSPTPTPIPTATITPTDIPITPSCPQYATYQLSGNTCQCDSGYVVNNDACVSYAEYCWMKYGNNSVYDTNSQGCTCASGYLWNSTNTSCISYDEVCHNQLGSNSYYNLHTNLCECYSGYGVDNGACVVLPTEPSIIPSLAVPVPTIADETVPMETPTPISDASTNSDKGILLTSKYPEVRTPTYYPLKVINVSDVSPIPRKSSTNSHGVFGVFSIIWNFIVHLF